MTQRRITDDLQVLLEVLPAPISTAVTEANNSDNLLEIILDLGRNPTARFVDKEIPLTTNEIAHTDLDYVVQRIGEFDGDNRAGLERTLHRISAIRNRRGHIVGLTCRVGRAVYGTIDIIQDLVESGKSLLILGKPGIGKTTMLREAARILAETKRVIIVDTSNEIGGDGDVPHPAVGKARRMQVSRPSLQHEVMIEAVENHNPEVIVIDEIGRELEAAAARTWCSVDRYRPWPVAGEPVAKSDVVGSDWWDRVGDAFRRGSTPPGDSKNRSGAPRPPNL
jgi:stage III sporulation protein SpoIIIAA